MAGEHHRADTAGFIGGDRDIATLAELLRANAVATITGPAGVGKTRLAVRYATLARGRYPGGVAFVSIEHARSSGAIVARIGAALGVELVEAMSNEAALDQLARAIFARGDVLVILDGADRSARDAADIASCLVERAPRARMLATSGGAIGAQGEAELELMPLPEDDAIALFEDRARLALSAFACEDDLDAVLALVRRLDGNPLAIELAAARVNVVSPRALLDRLEAKVERGRTSLDGIIACVWELCTPWEQDALEQCSVFRGAFSIDAAEATVAAHGAPTGTTVEDLIESLARRSLVRTSDDLYSLDEVVRSFAADRLAAARDADDVRARHAAWFTSGARPRAIDTDNLLAALEHARALEGDAAAAAGLAVAKALSHRGPASASLEILDAALEATRDRRLGARLLAARGGAKHAAGRIEEARRDAAAALAGARSLDACGLGAGDPEIVSACASLLANVELGAGDVTAARAAAEAAFSSARSASARARALFALSGVHHDAGEADLAIARGDDALRIARSIDDVELEVRIQNAVGSALHRRGRPDDAEARFISALELLGSVDAPSLEIVVRSNLGKTLTEVGRYDESRRLLDGALERARRMGSRRFEGSVQGHLGRLEHARADLHAARAHYDEALAIAREMRNRRIEAFLLDLRGVTGLEERRLDDATADFQLALTIAAGQGLAVLDTAVRLHRAALLQLTGRTLDARLAFASARTRPAIARDAELAACARALEGLFDVAAPRRIGGGAAEMKRSSAIRITHRIVAGAAALVQPKPGGGWFPTTRIPFRSAASRRC